MHFEEVSPNTIIKKKDGTVIGPVLNKAVMLNNYEIVELLLVKELILISNQIWRCFTYIN